MSERERFARVEALFHELIELEAGERARRLGKLAGEDPGLHAQLQQLFAESGALTERERALDGLVKEARSLAGGEPSMPERIGPYRIIRLLGEGGMGRVYEAEQDEPVRRRVALKLTRGGLDPERIISRFHAERQALAVLDHPNIARVHDAGTSADGRPWFAMELVDGEPITHWADRHRLGLKQRIELLLPVCEAVQHAHRKGLIHRDLKPSNLLVVDQDGVGVPKIIDFGIAKAIEAPAVARTLATRFGELVGTPEYMSPEQATLGAVDIDTRSDVYALGLVLYELLVGELPMSIEDLRRYAFDELCRRIREDDTPRPSVRLASQRRTLGQEPGASWARRLRGDLDSVVLKALAKDREQRYGTASALAEDLRRFLDDQPVLATPPRLGYRVRKFVRRNRAASLASAAVLLALVLGALLAGLGLVEARRSEARALAAQQTAEAATDFMVGLFEGADPRTRPGPEPSARELLDRGIERIAELDAQPPVQARLLEALGDASWALGAYDRAEPLLDTAIALRSAGATADPMRLAFLLDRRGGLLRDRADLAGAEASHRRALAVLAQAGLAESAETGRVLNNLGIVLRRGERFEEAVQVYQRAWQLASTLEPQPSSNAASAQANLAMVHQARGDAEAARRASLAALADFTRLLPEGHPYFGTLHSNIAVSSRRLGDLGVALRHSRAARAIDEAALPPGHADRADTLQGEAGTLIRLGHLSAARDMLLQAHRLLAVALGPDHPRLATAADSLAQIDLAEGDAAAAVARFSDVAAALAGNDQVSAQRHRVLVLRKLALAHRQLGEHEAAQAAAQASTLLATAGQRPADQGRGLLLQALIALDRQWPDEAEMLWQQALELLPDCLQGPCTLDQADTLVVRAGWHARRGESDAAFQTVGWAIDHAGWSAELLTNPDLAALHDDARWTRATQRLAARLAAAEEAASAAPGASASHGQPGTDLRAGPP